MKRYFVFVLLFIMIGDAKALTIWHYKMDSFAFQSDTIIYCKEQNIKINKVQHESWVENKTIVKCKVLKTFKGNIKKGTEINIEYNELFRRYLMGKGGYDPADHSDKIIRTVEPQYLPLGKALIFLKFDKAANKYEVVTSKLVQANGIFQFGQFEGSRGPLVLAWQNPENIILKKGQKYGEKEFLKDFAIALKKSLKLKEAFMILPYPPDLLEKIRLYDITTEPSQKISGEKCDKIKIEIPIKP